MDKLTSDQVSAKTASARPLGPEAEFAGTPSTPSRGVFPSDTTTEDGGVGVYVQFPWCIKKCPYCDFLSVPSARADIPHESYASAVLAEIAARRAELGPQ